MPMEKVARVPTSDAAGTAVEGLHAPLDAAHTKASLVSNAICT